MDTIRLGGKLPLTGENGDIMTVLCQIHGGLHANLAAADNHYVLAQLCSFP